MDKATLKILFLLAVLGLSLVACGPPAPPPKGDCELYANTPVCGVILDYYLLHGGKELFGYPITRQSRHDEMIVQYFSKAVIQHPANNPHYSQVHLRPLGLEMSELAPRVASEGDPDCRYFEPYGHLVCMQFLGFFDKVGGKDILGYPIAESKVVEGELVQDFENARLIWSTPAGDTPHVALADWGEQTCYGDGLICTYGASDDSALIPSQIDVFVLDHGGEAVFGNKVNELRERAGQALQCYQNACFVWDLNAAEPVKVIPLGQRSAPTVPRLDPSAALADAWYCTETGHSVVSAYKAFYFAHGGEAVFGRPLTEFMKDGEGWVQWFENVSFEWHPDRADGERVQLTPLGEIHYRQFGLDYLQVTPQPDSIEDEIALTIRPDYTLLPPDVPQVIHLWAKDSDGRPLANVAITLYLTTPSSRQIVQVPPTDATGETQLRLDSIQVACGEMVRLQAVTKTSDSTAGAKAQFTSWCNPAPDASQ